MEKINRIKQYKELEKNPAWKAYSTMEIITFSLIKEILFFRNICPASYSIKHRKSLIPL